MQLRKLAALESLLIAPAMLFMAALVTRYLHFPSPAQQIIDWYAHRMWTLWVLLLALPLIVLLTGCGALRIQQTKSIQRAPRAIYATTVAAGVIVTVVVLHMLAN